MVNSEVVADDGYNNWMGSFGNAYVSEYALYKNGYYGEDRYFDDRDEFKEYYYDYNSDELCEMFDYDPYINEYTLMQGKCGECEFMQNNKAEALMEEYLDKVADNYFIKAIIVDIGLPE